MAIFKPLVSLVSVLCACFFVTACPDEKGSAPSKEPVGAAAGDKDKSGAPAPEEEAEEEPAKEEQNEEEEEEEEESGGGW